MELFSGLVTGVAANLLTKAASWVGERITLDGWNDLDELTRLFYLLEGAYGDQFAGFKHGQLARTWGADHRFMEVHDRIAAGADPQAERRELVAAIEPLVTATADKTAHQIAEEVATFLPFLLTHSKQGDQQVLFELRRAVNVISPQLDRIETAVTSRVELIVISDWPSAAQDALARARSADPDGLGSLNQALSGRDRNHELPLLVRDPPGWMAGLSPEVWELIAVLCEEGGLWEDAERSWLTARELPRADYSGCSVRAAEAALAVGDRDRALELLAQARAHEPGHPRVLLHDALSEEDPEKALALLDSIRTDDPSTLAMIHIARASKYLEMPELSAARQSLDAARAAGAETMASYRLTSNGVAIAAFAEDPHPSAQVVGQRSAASLQLEAELRARRLPTQAAVARTQAASFYGLIGDFGHALEIIAQAAESYRSQDAQARLVLAMAAAELGSYDVVEQLVRPEDPQARAVYLRAVVRSQGDQAEKEAAARELESLLHSEFPQIRELAALQLLHLVADSGLDWNEEAAAIVSAHAPDIAVTFRMFWLERTGHPDQAEAELLAHSDQTWAIRELMRLAGEAGDWEKAARHAQALLNRELDWIAHLNAAETLRIAGRELDDTDYTERAMSEFGKLAEDQAAPLRVRTAAYERLTNQAMAAQRYGRGLELAEDWLTFVPEDADALWVKVVALALLGKDRQGLAVYEEHGLHPRRVYEAAMAGRLYLSVGEPVEALRKIVALADEQVPPNEELEALVVYASVRAGPAIPEDLRERVAAERFVGLFPQSQRVRALSLAELRDLMNRSAPVRAEQLRAIHEQVYVSRDMPTAVLSGLTTDDIGRLWAQLSRSFGLPLGYGNTALEQAELDDARAAIGGPVIWDATGIFVVDQLLTEHSETIRTAFPNASIAQSALDELAAAVRRLSFEETASASAESPEEPGGEPPAHVAAGEREVERAQTALKFAHNLGPVPDSDPADPQPEDEQLTPDGSISFRAMVATFGAARRLGLPIYSDDRDIRRRARVSGMRALGTLAVLEALAQRGLISDDERRQARRALLGRRGLGVHPSTGELVILAIEADWEITAELAIAIQDPGQWHESIPMALLTWTGFFYFVHRHAPEHLAVWVLRLLDAIERARPDLGLARHVHFLVALALISFEPDSASYTRALLRAFESARECCSTPLGDPAADGLISLIRVILTPQLEGRRPAITRAWTLLPLQDQVRLLPLLR